MHICTYYRILGKNANIRNIPKIIVFSKKMVFTTKQNFHDLPLNFCIQNFHFCFVLACFVYRLYVVIDIFGSAASMELARKLRINKKKRNNQEIMFAAQINAANRLNETSQEKNFLLAFKLTSKHSALSSSEDISSRLTFS